MALSMAQLTADHGIPPVAAVRGQLQFACSQLVRRGCERVTFSVPWPAHSRAPFPLVRCLTRVRVCCQPGIASVNVLHRLRHADRTQLEQYTAAAFQLPIDYVRVQNADLTVASARPEYLLSLYNFVPPAIAPLPANLDVLTLSYVSLSGDAVAARVTLWCSAVCVAESSGHHLLRTLWRPVVEHGLPRLHE
jgi:hypothetical protein